MFYNVVNCDFSPSIVVFNMGTCCPTIRYFLSEWFSVRTQYTILKYHVKFCHKRFKILKLLKKMSIILI